MVNYLSRQRTPTSPSPSPEPVGGGGGASGEVQGGAAGTDSAADVPALSAPLPSTMLMPAASLASSSQGVTTSGGVGEASMEGAGGSATGTVQDASEIARQVLEEKVRIGVDDLMQLAMCAGDVQPGDEEIVRMKM